MERMSSVTFDKMLTNLRMYATILHPVNSTQQFLSWHKAVDWHPQRSLNDDKANKSPEKPENSFFDPPARTDGLMAEASRMPAPSPLRHLQPRQTDGGLRVDVSQPVRRYSRCALASNT